MTLGQKISAVARERHIDLAEVGRRAGISYNTLKHYTKPESATVPSAVTGIAIAKALDVAIEWLFDDSQGLPAVPYHDPPPFRIAPWPPLGLTWEELAAALRLYVHDRTERYLREANERLSKGGKKGALRIGPPMPVSPPEDGDEADKPREPDTP